MVKVLFFGATGHIGGAVLDVLVSTSLPLDITALVRDESKAKRLRDKYTNVKTIIGALENVELVKSAANRGGDYTSPDVSHFLRIEGILHALGSRETRGYYIHTSGAALYGTSQMDHLLLVFSAHSTVNVAIVSPVMVYGLSPSLEHPIPLTFPELTKAIRFLGSGFTVSTGKNLIGYIHVKDLARIYLILLSHALGSTPAPEGIEIWGPEAYYFDTAQELSFADLMKTLVGVWYRKGVLANENIKPIDIPKAAEASGAAEDDDPQSWARHIAASCEVNMRVKSTRARRIGWVPKEARLEYTIEDVAARFLDIEKGA